MTKSKAELIARTESSKASTALMRARMAVVGFMWYVWKTSHDSRARSSHSHMDSVLVNWNDPLCAEKLIKEKNVGPYHAGDIYNCRCYPAPLVDYDEVNWPAKVYWRGKVERMSLSKFKKMQGGEL